ncbi:type II toxin-antitoxin system RelE/ParE family toxin [Cupriavidus sp. D39]|uniref:type II toxin-antitoxin system RelE/ParE family toxin n=1 Tax=Cupriavidus sp. D39 TaxID=2997877 RepID=UPI00226DD423|nr:type II toxin-antitoxin system RelE/ParE family toxin [Cupriavidus sp. D39]MCY0857189.1 type II toxin-antitoxin system RelE/ParE family toxin [Cupriavidus sp. D39]
MTSNITVRLTANFERNLERLEQFLLEADAPQAFDALLDELLDNVIPALERFPELGSPLLGLRAGSIESRRAQEALREKAGDAQLRQYVLSSYLILYAVSPTVINLLSIKHHRQLSFDFGAFWPGAADTRQR